MSNVKVSVLLIFGFCSVWAQITTGEIIGKVSLSNESGPAPGVVITIEGQSLQGQRSAVTQANGSFRFPVLPIGKYTATFTLAGFQTKKVTGIVVSTSEKTKIEVVLESSGVQEELVVTAAETLIDTTTTDSRFVMNEDDLAVIPTLARTVEDAAKYVPGVTGVRADSVNGGEGGLPVIRGGGQEGNQYVVDGLSVRSSQGFGNGGITQNFDSIQSLEVVSDPFSPEYGKSLGGAINVITKSGGDNFSGELGYHYRDDGLESDREPVLNPTAVTGFDRNKMWANLGGYVIKEKLWFFTSFNYDDPTNVSSGAAPRLIDSSNLVNQDGSPVGQPFSLYDYQDGEDTSETSRGFFKLTYNINQDQNLDFSFLTTDFDRTASIGHEDLFLKSENEAERFRLNYQWIMSHGGVIEFKAGHQTNQSIVGGVVDHGIASRQIIDEAWRYANRTRFDDTTQDRTDFSAKFTGFYPTENFGTHELIVGLEAENYETQWFRNNTGFNEDVFVGDSFDEGVNFAFHYLSDDQGRYVLDSFGQPILVPDSLTERRNAKDLNEVDGMGFFIQDRITLDRLTVMIGLRADQMSIKDDFGDEIWKWDFNDFLSPRLSVVYDIMGDQKHVAKVAYGIFKDSATTRIGEFFNREGGNAFRDYAWYDPNHINPSEAELHNPDNWVFVHEQSAESTPFLFEEGLKPNEAERLLLEYNWQYQQDHAFTMRYAQNDQKDLLEDIGFLQDGNLIFLLANFEHKRRNYQGLDLLFNGRLNRKWNYSFAYTWTDSKGTNPGNFENETLNNPGGSGNYVGVFGDHIATDGTELGDFFDQLTDGLGGRGIGDEGWYGKLSDSVDNSIVASFQGALPYGFDTSLVYQWVDGYFYTKKGFQDIYHGYFTFPEGRGSRQTDSAAWTDLSLGWTFQVRTTDIKLRADLLNAFDEQNATSVVEEDTPQFGTPLFRQEPRRFNFGIEVRF